MERIHFQSGGQRIDGTLVAPRKMQKKNPGIVFFHGMTSSEKGYIPIAERLAQHGIVGMTLSIRGHGTSEGDFNALTVNDAVVDGLSAFDFFARYDFIDQSRVGLCGGSVGAAITAMVSADKEVKSMILRAPATYTEEMMKMTFQEIMSEEGQIFRRMSNISDTPPVRAIAQFKGDLLVVTSENDAVIPVAVPTQYLLEARQTKSKKLIQIDGAEHNLTGDKREQFIDEVVRWFVSTI